MAVGSALPSVRFLVCNWARARFFIVTKNDRDVKRNGAQEQAYSPLHACNLRLKAGVLSCLEHTSASVLFLTEPTLDMRKALTIARQLAT